jgi:hypothetical protein
LVAGFMKNYGMILATAFQRNFIIISFEEYYVKKKHKTLG